MLRNPIRNDVRQILLNVANSEWRALNLDRPGTYNIRGSILDRAVIQIRFLHREGNINLIFENDCNIANNAIFIIQGNAASRCIIHFNVPLAHTVKMKMQRAQVFFGQENVTNSLSDLTSIGNRLSDQSNKMTDVTTAQPLGSLVIPIQHVEGAGPNQAPYVAGFVLDQGEITNHRAPHLNRARSLDSQLLPHTLDAGNTQSLPHGFSASTAAIYVLLQALSNRSLNFNNSETILNTTYINNNGSPYNLLVQNPNARTYQVPPQTAFNGPMEEPITLGAHDHATDHSRNRQAYIIPRSSLTSSTVNVMNNMRGTNRITQDLYSPQVKRYADTFKDSNNEKSWEEAKTTLPDKVKKDFYHCAITQDMPTMPVFIEQQIYDYESLKRWVEGLGKRGPEKFSDPTTGLLTHVSKISAPIADFWSMVKFRIQHEKSRLKREATSHDQNKKDQDGNNNQGNGPDKKQPEDNGATSKRRRFK